MKISITIPAAFQPLGARKGRPDPLRLARTTKRAQRLHSHANSLRNALGQRDD